VATAHQVPTSPAGHLPTRRVRGWTICSSFAWTQRHRVEPGELRRHAGVDGPPVAGKQQSAIATPLHPTRQRTLARIAQAAPAPATPRLGIWEPRAADLPSPVSACRQADPAVVRKRSEARRLGAGDAHSGIRRPGRRAAPPSKGIVTSAVTGRALRHASSRENALLLQRGAVVGRFRNCIREEQSPAAVAAAVAKA
jgi:hypothetical protein